VRVFSLFSLASFAPLQAVSADWLSLIILSASFKFRLPLLPQNIVWARCSLLMHNDGWSLNKCKPVSSFQPPNCISQTDTDNVAASMANWGGWGGGVRMVCCFRS